MDEDSKKASRMRWFAYFSGLLFWALLTYWHTANTLIEGELFCRQIDGNTSINDFLIFYNSGGLAWQALEQGSAIYSPEIQRRALAALLPPIDSELVFFSQNPPYTFMLLMPLAALPLMQAWLAQISAGAIALAVTCRAMLKSAPVLASNFSKAFYALALFASYPTWLSFRLGQISLFVFPLIVFFWLSLFARRFFLAGLLGGLCLLKLQYMPIIFLVGLIIGRGRFLAGFTLVAVLLIGCSALIVGPEAWISYPEALHFAETSPLVTGVAVEMQQNLRGQLFLIFGKENQTSHYLVTSVWLLASVAIALAWWRLRKKLQEARLYYSLAAITILTQLITSPHTHSQDYIFAGASCLWLYNNVVYTNRSALVILILGFPILSWAMFLSTQLLPMIIEPFALWGIVMLALSINELILDAKLRNN